MISPMPKRPDFLCCMTDMLHPCRFRSQYGSKASWLLKCHRLSGSRAGPAGLSGTLYDGGCVLQQLRDKVFAVCVSQTGARSPCTCLWLQGKLHENLSPVRQQHVV